MKDLKYVKQTPHCDAKVLHKQGSCQFCDAHPEWQELRQIWGIAFTGHSEDTATAYDHQTGEEYQKPLIPCPSEWDRPVETIHNWHGNRPEPPEGMTGPSGPGACPEGVPWPEKPKATLSDVDRSKQQLTNGSPVPKDGSHTRLRADGQQEDYVVLNPEERARGFVRPVRLAYVHIGKPPVGVTLRYPINKVFPGGCGSRTRMGLGIAETFARDPGFYTGGTFCCACQCHVPLDECVWEGGTEVVGS